MIQTACAQVGVAALCAIVCVACSSAPAKQGGGGNDVATLADHFFDDVVFKYQPTRGTRAGLHQYDTRLEDFSRPSIDAQLAALKDYEQRLQSVRVPADAPDAA